MYFFWHENGLRVITFDPLLSPYVMTVTIFHISFNKGNNTAIVQNNMSHFGWVGAILGP